uniref:StAR related lipid transfer domain containing 3 n=1 Tax=Hippocampus comes TaxID=109280 RepID=A0A3Q3D6T3_HIPCM
SPPCLDHQETATGDQSEAALGAQETDKLIQAAQVEGEEESEDGGEGRGTTLISDVRRTFCLFVTFDLLFISLLWIIELNISSTIWDSLEKEVIHYNFRSSFFDICLLALFRFLCLQVGYAAFRLRHWWVIAVTTLVTSVFLVVKVIVSNLLSQNAFGYVLPITSFVVAWLETWFLDFKVLPQEADDERVNAACERAPVMYPRALSDGQFYSPPESVAGNAI